MEEQSYGYTAQTQFGNIDFTYRPLVAVEVGGETETRTVKALVDSGTDITMIDKTIADLLGIHYSTRDIARASALGTETEEFLAPVSLKIDRFDRVFNFKVLFVENLSHNFEIILGQQDFFQNFDVTFKKSQNKFYLQSINN